MELIKLTPEEFRQTTKLIYERTGIHLPESKLTLLSNRLRRRVRALRLTTFAEYYELIRDPGKCQDELPHFLSAVTTNETYFFRNERLWHYFRHTWIPQIEDQNRLSPSKTVRIWSAASSSGEEAYTAALCLREALRDFDSWNVTIIGSDISERVLEQARRGEYNDYALSKTPEALRRKWFDERDGLYVLKPELRRLVTFKFHNLRDRFPGGRFDLVFLRNVLMYFDLDMKKRVLTAVSDALAPGGQLVVGDVDPIRNTPELNDALTLAYCGPNLYRKPSGSRVAAAAKKG